MNSGFALNVYKKYTPSVSCLISYANFLAPNSSTEFTFPSVLIKSENLLINVLIFSASKFGLINSNGTVSSVEELGKRRLAYEIKKLNEGYYVVVKFEAKPELITELERVYRITDEVIKFIVVKEEE